MAAILMLLAALLLAYTWFGYTAILALCTAVRGRAQRAVLDSAGVPPAPQVLPSVAVVLSAFNEQDCIGARIGNLLACDYPAERLSIHIGVDGATDRTAACAMAAAGPDARVRVRAFAANRGKVAVLKDLVRDVVRERGPDLLVFTDANTVFAADVLLKLAAPFADARVGGVCGRLVFVEPDRTQTAEDPYWRWETWLKTRESGLDSCLGANGAIYAIRSGLFWDGIPDNTVIDDFVLGMKVREQGWRMVFEPSAVAEEPFPPRVADEWVRRTRIGAGDYQALRLCARCLLPRFGRFAWAFWSHKVLRWFTPHLLLVLLLADAWLLFVGAQGGESVWPAPAPAERMMACGVLGCAVAAVIVVVLDAAARGVGWRSPFWVRGGSYFLAMQAALAVGFLRFLKGDLAGRWTRSAR